MTHLEKLRLRVQDTASKVLVTGDLNAGKSTFVNTLLQRDVMPVDQQPCTSSFCEVHDVAENNGVEEVHIVKDAAAYDVRDASTYEAVPLAELERIVDEADAEEEEDVVEAARLLQQQIVYNGEVLDIAFESMRTYKEGTQSLAYLDAAVNLAYSLLKMLERWSKRKGSGEVYVRKKAKAKKRKGGKSVPEGEGVPDVEEEAEDRDEEEVINETMFTFDQFEQVRSRPSSSSLVV